MSTVAGPIVFMMFVGVCAVSRVPAFAQSDSGRDQDELHASHSVVRVYSRTRGDDHAVALATNVVLSAAYRELVDAMLARSPTFRRQYARVARALHLSVIVRSDIPAGRRMPALTHISARPGGGVEALVYVTPSPRAAELIAHEFEHIIERLDGVNLRAKARLRASGVTFTADQDTFETTRAVVAGQRVAREILESGY